LRPLMVGLVALALVACDVRPTTTPTNDALTVTIGARVTKLHVTQPASIATLWTLGLEISLADGSLVLLVAASTQSGTTMILGGTGEPVAGSPGTYTFVETLTPTNVTAETTPRPDGRTDFTTVTAFDWSLPFHPQEPWMPLHHGGLGGSLDPQGVPTADVPPLSGTLRGCFTVEEAQALYVHLLNESVYELSTSSGGRPDADCGSGTIDGFAFEAQWEASEVVQLVEAG
jgi:hypothetical protein